jgi:hypothetical protein
MNNALELTKFRDSISWLQVLEIHKLHQLYEMNHKELQQFEKRSGQIVKWT